MQLLVNHNPVDLEVHPGGVALDLLRGPLGLSGVKEGCREGDCGACTILHGHLQDGRIIYQSVVSCLLPLGDCAGTHLVTIEGLNPAPAATGPFADRHPVTPLQQAFVDQGAIQCGFCTPGLVMALTGWLLNAASWDEEEALLSVAGNICRCTGYLAIRRAIRQVLTRLPDAAAPRLDSLIAAGYLPAWFAAVPAQLAALQPPAAAGAARGTDEPAVPEAAAGIQLDGAGKAAPDADEPALSETAVELRPSAAGAPAPGIIRVAGGTDLFVQKPEALESASLELLSRRPDLGGITVAAGHCRIGGAVTVEELRRSSALATALPGLPHYLRLISSTQIRNRATVAGNLVNASPIGDLTILLLALAAEVELSDNMLSRHLPLRAFYLGYKKLDLQEGELVAAVHFALPGAGDLFNFEKVSRREHLDIASVNSACLLRHNGATVEEVHLSAGGVAPVPLYLERCCAYLRGRELDEAVLTEALRVAGGEIAPMSDVRGTAEYKQLLLGQLLRAHFIRLLPGRFAGEEA